MWKVGFKGGEVTFNDEGVHIYYCTPHRVMAMYGVIQVGEATNKDEAMSAAANIKGTLVMSQDRLDNYMGQVE